MPDLNYRHLRYFQAVALDGTLTGAARRLNLSQSALSVQIRELEARLGHALFERRGRGLHLTEAGRIALDHAAAIFGLGEELVDTLRSSGRARQALRVGALATLSRNFLLDFLRPALGRPEVEVIVRSGGAAELLPALEALRLDLVVVNRPPEQDAATPFLSHRLAEQPVTLVGRPAMIEAGRDLAALLAAHPVVLPTAESGARIGFDALMDRLSLRPQVAAEVDDMALMRLLAREGVGLAVLPLIVVKDEIESGALVACDLLPGLVETFHAVTLRRRFPNPLLRLLLDREMP